MEKTITLGGRSFELLREQRGGAALYKSNDQYLRMGPASRIARDLEAHRAMEAAGYPVPPVITHGAYGDLNYFVEESLGEKTFRIIFEEDIKLEGSISRKNFSDFLGVTERLLLAQTRSPIPSDPRGFAEGVHLNALCEELPQYSISLPDKFARILRKIEGFPYVLSHGDYNAANILPRGIIDFEDAFPGPFGFDAVSAISTVEWFPESSEYEYYTHYRYSATQKEEYLDLCDAVSESAGYPKISSFYDDFAFCRAIWSTVRMHAWPKLQAWRYDKFIKTYLYN